RSPPVPSDARVPWSAWHAVRRPGFPNHGVARLRERQLGPRVKESDMARTGGDILIEALLEWGVDTVFGLPGDGINGVMEALRTRRDKIKFVHVRHEESAAFMACGYAKFTGKLGVCIAT